MIAPLVVAVTMLWVCSIGAPPSRVLYGVSTVPPGWSVTNEPVNSTEFLRLTVGLHRSNLDMMEAIFWDVSTPTHVRYGEHLDHAAMRRLMSPGPNALGAVLAWIRAAGIENVTVGRHEDSIKVVATLFEVEQLLGVHFRIYKHNVSGRRLARALDAVHIPAHVAAAVEVVAGHSGFPPRNVKAPPHVEHITLRSPTRTNVTPAVLYATYNVTVFPQAPDGQRSIQSFYQYAEYTNQSDLSAFCDKYLTDAPFPSNITADCRLSRVIGANRDLFPGENTESALDSEYLLAAGALAETWLYALDKLDFCGDLMHWAFDVFDSSDGLFPHVISMSYVMQQAPNVCLGPDVQRLAQDVQKMGTMGISVLIASGDDGSGEYYGHGAYYNEGLLAPSFPASIPYCTAVGATTFVQGNSGEQMATTVFGSGGGFSYDFPAPVFQADALSSFFNVSNVSLLPPVLSYNASGRGTPDVALLGEGYNVIDQLIDYSFIAGTSASTPVFAGFVTLLNNIRLAKGKTLGFLNPLLYSHPDVFDDIIVGNNDVKGNGYGWHCTKGWDPVTGLGAPNIGKLMDVVRALP